MQALVGLLNSEVDLRISFMQTNNNIKIKTANAEDQISKAKASKRELKGRM